MSEVRDSLWLTLWELGNDSWSTQTVMPVSGDVVCLWGFEVWMIELPAACSALVWALILESQPLEVLSWRSLGWLKLYEWQRSRPLAVYSMSVGTQRLLRSEVGSSTEHNSEYKFSSGPRKENRNPMQRGHCVPWCRNMEMWNRKSQPDLVALAYNSSTSEVRGKFKPNLGTLAM